ncbi:Flavodoxin reductase (ferredoxin-NADPH reductase) family 1, Vanillate O-demethylase oxidoreductase [Pseudonocardia sp. Ae168_Ps1]|uniref:PDR/VanB family oxidoreductase n=1 Tax=unclassified Pseudonocardia TaxID=2619320 RepID=UPI00094B5650|nr:MULTISPECIES: PDR/VanB family oxidoreductase [unclassified Pseudonocardia]OLL71734.1 Flavodoxin reductase (ferredoxin-NADPH reductase) family 1 Vanillate O-demethylase oxidoreductase [Pseudonocardia sp. Ae150A_Ps1]OLL77702.1 Flavodoxin reductase (ferredoxin-NADPH reductase) family 1, Vanillate O-demethylase oxidoreductase [Pseudonocardia sp. Ae168_Ps1]OLL88175.1 Flavodoxin reductase (ferredoxin-NADPH reductase) family 1, Vanillate O-demethylase oxidoreductase [Pseudonocardia sp. Ae263_Ps1]OL
MTLDLVVAALGTPCPGVRSLELAPAGGGPLPSYPPGSHVAVRWAPHRWNPYSLTGPSVAPERLHLAVALRPDGHGGSRWMHALAVGDRVRASRPRATFRPVETATHHLLVAGGIGVTPVLSHARWHAFWGHRFTVLFVHRPGVAPHLEELRAVCGDRLEAVTGRAAALVALRRLLGSAPFGSHLHVCGPPGLIAAAADAARAAHWPDARIHAEAFVHAPEPGRPFRAVLRRSGRTVDVGARESLLDALDRAGIPVPRMCRQGVCGECATTVHAGAVDHRDSVLDPADRDHRMTPCVSRAGGDSLELDL